VRITANEVLLEGLVINTEYEVEVTPVDTLGSGSSATATFTTQNLVTADVSGLSNWATETDPVDLTFINANLDDDALPSTKIASITATKITAGTVSVTVDLGTGVKLDGANGYVQTVNDDYSVFLGPVSRASLSSNPLALHAWDDTSSTSTFWFDTAGNFALGNGGYTYDISTTTHILGDFDTGKYILFDGVNFDFGINTSIGNTTDRTVTVGSGEDYPTINEALEDLSKVYASYKNGGFTATIELKTGYIINESIGVFGVDLSWITIISVDSVVEAKPDGLTLEEKQRGLFYADNGKMPNIEINLEITTSTMSFYYYIFNVNNEGFIKVVGSKTLEFSGNASAMVVNGDTLGKVIFEDYEITNPNATGTCMLVQNAAIVRFQNLIINDWNSSFVILQSFTKGRLLVQEILTTNDVETPTQEPSVSGLLYCASSGDIAIGTLTMNSTSGNTVNRVASGGAGGTLYIGQGSARFWTSFGVRGARCNFMVNGDYRKTGTSGTTDDFKVGFGAIIQATGSLGDVSQTVNVITSDGLIIK
jgi:hypothetical protein